MIYMSEKPTYEELLKRVLELEKAELENKRNSEALHRSQVMMARTERIANVGSWEWEIATDRVTWSDELFRIFQLDPDEKVPSWAEHSALYHPEDIESLRHAVEASVADGTPYELELRALRKDGEIRVCLACGFAETGLDGRATRLFGSLQDITDRKQAEDALIESEIHLRTLVQTIPDLVWLKDTDGVYLDCNVMFERFFGAEKKDIIGRTDYDFVDRELADFFLEHDRKAMAADKPSRNEEWLTFADDGYRGLFDTIKTPMRNTDGKLIGVLGIARNITNLKRVDEALRESEERYRKAFMTSPDSIVITRLSDGMFVSINKGFTEITGYEEADVIGKTSLEINIWVNPEDRINIINGLKARGEVRNYEARFLAKDREFYGVMSASIIELNGMPHILNVTRDITDRKQAEDVLRASEKRIQKKLNNLLSSESDIGELELADIIDTDAIQTMMDDFYKFTRVPVSIIDLKGKVLVGTGWQDICTKFHRVHPETLRNCLECDTILTEDVPIGTFKSYLCKNHLWDNVTPLVVGGRHVGNLFTGQFFYEGEKPDDEIFRSQAARYGFDEQEYMAAVKRVPTWNREAIQTVLVFYTKFANMISSLSHANIGLAKALEDHKRTVKVLKESERHYRELIEGTPGIVYSFSSKRGGMFYSAQVNSILGYSPEQLYAQPMLWHDSIHPDDLLSVDQSILKAASYKPFCIEYRIQDVRGNWHWFEDRSTGYHIDGTDVIMEGLALDITERKLAEEALRSSNSHFQRIVSTVPAMLYDYILYPDGSNRFIYVSPNCHDILEREDKEILQDMDVFWKMIHPDDIERLQDEDIAANRLGRTFNVEVRIITKSERMKWVQLSSRPNPAPPGVPAIWSGYVLDITERKHAEAEKAELEAQNRQLQKSESLGRMAGAIAHHFNNQLYAVMGNLEMAMDDLPLGVNSNESLVSAMQAARKAAELSRLMLTYLGQTPGNQKPIDLSETCRQSLTLLHAATPKGIILNADFPSSGPVIRADTNQMHQILTNMVTNAWESISDSRGTIDLIVKTVSHEDIPTLKLFPIDWQPQEIDYACLEVSDTGSGIANKDIEKIFDPFFTTKFTGRGLGLPVVMGIIKAHSGGITVESEQERGSVFRFFLPVSTEELPIQHDLPAISEALLTDKAEKLSKIVGGGTVLLIEDEDPVRIMTKKMLTRLGYPVLEAKDGFEALEIFQQHQDKICFVLSDLTMPRMDGWETLAAFRKLSPDIPVILSSGYDEAQVMAGEHTEQPSAFLGKPYQLKGLRDTISRVLAE